MGTNGKDCYIIDRKSKEIKTFSKGYSTVVTSHYLSPDGFSHLELKDYKNTLLINEQKKDTLNIDIEKPNNYAFTPDGKSLIIASSKLFAKVFDVNSGKETKTLIPNDEHKCDGCDPKISCSPDSKYLAFYERYNGLTVWNLSNGKKQVTYGSKENKYNTITFSYDGKLILLSNDDQCEIIAVENGKSILNLKNEYFSQASPELSRDGKFILCPNSNFTSTIHSVKNSKNYTRFKGFFNEQLHDNITYDHSKWTDVHILNYLKNKTDFEISPNGKYLAQSKIDTVIVLFDLENGTQNKILKGHTQQVISIAFSPDGSELVSGDAKGEIIRWNVDKGEIITRFKAHVDIVFDVVFNENGTELLTASWDGTVKHWGLTTNQLLGTIKTENAACYSVSFSKRDLYITANCFDNKIHCYETDSKELIRTMIGHTQTISDFMILKDGNQLVSASWDGYVKIWDFQSATLIDKIKNPSESDILSIAKNVNETLYFLGSADRKIYVYDVLKRTITHSFVAHQSAVSALKIHPTENILYSRSIEGEIKSWDLATYTNSFNLIQISQQDWLITEPNGHFDGTDKAMKFINYVSGMKALEVGSLFKKYYYPGLYNHINAGNRFIEQEQGLNNLMEEIPSFEIQFSNFQKQMVMVNEDSSYRHQKSTLEVELSFLNNQKNIEKISVYNNGKLIKEESFSDEVTFRGNATKRNTTLTLSPESNFLEFALTTDKGITTSKKSLSVFFDTIGGKTELFVLAIGINQYENNAYNLKYAQNDATEFVKSLEKSAGSIFEKIYPTIITNKDATKQTVQKKILDIQHKMGPEDVFVFYYAGHGMMYENPNEKSNDFYLIMSDITNLYGDKKMLDSKGISAKELLKISKDLSAQKQIFVLDACQSGAALNELAVRGFEREKTLAQLARNTGTFFLTAAQDSEYANEVGTLKHGIFTYAILELLNGENAASKKDETISIYQLKSYVESRVPELSKIHHGSSQYPTGYSFGNDFPIGVVK